MNRQKSINSICDLLALFVQQVKAHNAAGSFDINRFSENVLIPILAEAYDWRGLVNLNSEKNNYPGIDLGDQTNRVAFQISSNTNIEKVKDALEKFFKYRRDEQYDRLIIYNITEKKPSRSSSDSTDITKGKFSFSRKSDVWDYSDLLKRVNSLSLAKIETIEHILEREFAEIKRAGESLNYLNDLSRVVANDANFVTKENDSEKFILLGDDLYVTRTIEEKISDILKEQESPLVLISGEAGRGKTSLLWNLFHSLRRNPVNETWFLKSTMLKSEKLWQENFEVVQSAIKDITAKNKRPILLLDTIDLLLHDEASRDLLVSFLLKISEKRCVVVAACRPQELSKLSAVIFRKITLRDYESGEFEEAVRKHAARFYSASARQKQSDQTQKILEAVARGLPVREVCTNPLTLRMLFTIYAPAQIEDDINVFKLYKEYWRNRVEKDLRAGSPFANTSDAADDSDNLEETTAKIAICMLAEGLPELKYKQLQSKLGNWRIIGREVGQLISRGIIRRSQDDSVTFFHQTFFEHSAARGLLIFFKDRALSLLQNRLQSDPNDLFTAPIYEQVLLLAEDDSAKLMAQADDKLLELFESKNIFAVRSGLYVYSHRRRVSAQVDEAVAAILINSDEATQIRFLELAPNAPASRLTNLFDTLDLLWAGASERTKEHLLKLLVRLAPRDYGAIKKFFQKHDLFGYARGLKEYSNVARTLLQIIKAVAYHDANWGWDNLIEFCEVSTRLTKGRELAIAAINFLCEKAVLFNPSEIATKFEKDTSAVSFDEARDFDELSESNGILWLTEWKANKFPIPQVYANIENVSAGVGMVARMKGFGKLIAAGTEQDAEFALTKYERETEPYRRSLWREAVIPNWLNAKLAGDAEQPKTGVSGKSLLLFLKRKISSLDSAASANKKPATEMSDFAYSIMLSSISTTDFLKIVDRRSFLSAEHWLRTDLLGPILVHGIIAGHPGALKAAEIMADNPEPYWSRMAGTVGMKMIDRLHNNELLADIFFNIVIKAKDSRLILRMLETIVDVPPPAFIRHQDEIFHLSWSFVTAPKNPSEKRYGLMILDKLLKYGAEPRFEFVELIGLLNQEKKNQQNLGKIASIIARSIRNQKFNLEKVIDELRLFATGDNEELRRAGTLALVKAIEESGQNVSDYIYGVLEAVIVPPLNAERLTALRPLIEKMLPQDARAAADVLQKLLIAGSTLGNNGRHKIFGRLKPTARRIVKFADIETRRELLGFTPKLDRILASMVVDAICHESLSDLSRELDGIFELEVPGEIKETIIKYRYTQEREFGGKEWSELYEILEKDKNPKLFFK